MTIVNEEIYQCPECQSEFVTHVMLSSNNFIGADGSSLSIKYSNSLICRECNSMFRLKDATRVKSPLEILEKELEEAETEAVHTHNWKRCNELAKKYDDMKYKRIGMEEYDAKLKTLPLVLPLFITTSPN